MTNLKVCRICLQVEVRMHTITGTKLQDIYEKLMDKVITNDDSKPACVCYICYAQLRSCLQLSNRAQNADSILNLLLQANSVITTDSVKGFYGTSNLLAHNYCVEFIHPILEVSYDIKIEDRVELKNEDETKVELVIKNEYDNDINEKSYSSSDSEFDVPLKDIKKRQNITKEVVKVREKNTRKKEVIKVDAKEIILSHTEQLADMMKRAQSDNYINSPYKCELCYKGFIDSRAYDNHREKHSESCGEHVCPMCKLRYRTERHLRTHVAGSHARRYACNKCACVTHTASQARDHEKWHNGFTYECQICSHQFSKPTSYLSHMRKVHPSTHVCTECGASFLGTHGLHMHYTKTHRNHTRENESEPASERFCNECGIQFQSVVAWKRHRIVKHARDHTNSSHCPICKQEVDESILASHVRRHAGELRDATVTKRDVTPASCEQCGGKFVNRYKLQAHIKRMHLGIKYNKNIICEVCGKKCTSLASLKSHSRTHTNARPYPCPECGARFRDAHQLRLHARTHSGERPYACHVCPLTFTQRPALTRHHRVHTGAKPYVCQFCSRAFTQSSSLKVHVNTVHLKIPPKRRRNKVKNTMDSDHEQKSVLENV